MLRDNRGKELLIRCSSNQSNYLLNSESRPELYTSTITNSIKTTGKKKNNFKSIEVRNSSQSKKLKSVRSTLPPHPPILLSRPESHYSNLPPINSHSSLLLRYHNALSSNYNTIVHQEEEPNLVDQEPEIQPNDQLEEEEECALLKQEQEEKVAGEEAWRAFQEKRRQEEVLRRYSQFNYEEPPRKQATIAKPFQ